MRYLGNKDSITDIIKEIISDKVNIQPNTVFFDGFCGTGSVSNSFKAVCNIVINDNLNCASTYAYGRMVAASCTFGHLGFNPIDFFNENDFTINGYFYNTYSPGGSARMYLSEHNAGRIDYFRETIENWHLSGQITEPEYRYLLACLIESISFVSNTAGVYGAFLKKWDERALKNIQFLNISDGIVNAQPIQVFSNKLEDIISDIQCDVLYLDPPYTQNQYGTQYHLLETLILNDKPENVSKVTGSRSTREMRSDWSKIYKVHILFDKILASTTARHIFLSYNNDGDMSKDFIEALMKRYAKDGTYECISIPYKKYENWKSQNKKEARYSGGIIKNRPVHQFLSEDWTYGNLLTYTIERTANYIEISIMKTQWDSIRKFYVMI